MVSGLLQCAQGPRADLLDRALALYLAVSRRARIALRRPLRIVVAERPGLLLVDIGPLPDGLLLVVLALHQRLAGDVVFARRLRGIEADVVVAPGTRVRAPPGQAPDDLVVIDVDLEDEVKVDVRLTHRFRLVHRSLA